MSLLVITPFKILVVSFIIIVIYITAIALLLKNKSGILPYVILILFPVIGPLGIIFGSLIKKQIRE